MLHRIEIRYLHVEWSRKDNFETFLRTFPLYLFLDLRKFIISFSDFESYLESTM